jgi:hypothetical protein
VRPYEKFVLTAAGLLFTWAIPAYAGVVQASFAVNINLNNPGGSGYCINQTLSQSTNAIVNVVCSTNQFVSIEPQPGKPFLGTHGGAYHFVLAPRKMLSSDDPLWYIGVGTITTMRVIHDEGREDMLEMLVSF